MIILVVVYNTNSRIASSRRARLLAAALKGDADAEVAGALLYYTILYYIKLYYTILD